MPVSEAQRYCTTLTKRSGSNFYYSFLFLPRERREAMYTVYAFCREVDGVVDHPPAGADPIAQLEKWRIELAAAYQGQPTHPVAISLAEHVHRLTIPREYFEELIAGVEMDLTIARYATFSDLYRYCYRVASVVGLICLRVFGTRSPLAEEYAVNLGLAFQLTNILRDVATDAERGRIYLPQEDLTKFGCSEDAFLKRTYSPAFLDLMSFESRRARDFYRKAENTVAGLPDQDRRALTAAEIMRNVYSRILDRIESSGYRVLGTRVTLPASYRLAIAAGVWLRSRLPWTKAQSTPVSL